MSETERDSRLTRSPRSLHLHTLVRPSVAPRLGGPLRSPCPPEKPRECPRLTHSNSVTPEELMHCDESQSSWTFISGDSIVEHSESGEMGRKNGTTAREGVSKGINAQRCHLIPTLGILLARLHTASDGNESQPSKKPFPPYLQPTAQTRDGSSRSLCVPALSLSAPQSRRHAKCSILSQQLCRFQPPAEV